MNGQATSAYLEFDFLVSNIHVAPYIAAIIDPVSCYVLTIREILIESFRREKNIN